MSAASTLFPPLREGLGMGAYNSPLNARSSTDGNSASCSADALRFIIMYELPTLYVDAS